VAQAVFVSAPEAALRQALETALAGDGNVLALLGDPLRLSEVRSKTAAYPHASWGRAQSQARDGDGVALIEHRLTLDIWCRDGGAAEVTGQLRDALRGLELVLPAPWTLVSLMPVYSDVFATRDFRVSRGVIRLRALMGQVG
jgi:hypothetical protein